MRKCVSLGRRLALAIVLGGIFAGAAQAQPYTGKITLPNEVRWGGAALPAGEYTLRMENITGPLSIVDASGRVRALVSGFADEATRTQPASLQITGDGAERTVRSLNCPAWGRRFIYLPFTRAERERLASGERTETVTVRTVSR